VLVDEVVSLIQPRTDGVYVDCTIGLGGHTAALLAAGAGRVLGLDRDEAALDAARARLGESGRVDLVHADYRELPRVLREHGLDAVDGALADLGVSSMQLDDPGRGFSFRMDGPLDMRMDRSRGVPVSELIRQSDEATLADVIFQFGEERHARRVARAIVRARDRQPLTRTTELASVVRSAAGGRGWQRIDPATRTFQALRIWVNRELDGLDAFLIAAAAALRVGGRLAVIAFHSLEDRVVKQTFRALSAPVEQAPASVRLITRKPIVPGDTEISRNPRARSARLRGLERVA
jgi:16S rRNA (cytosine1402-N4)-methyltransferase